MDERLGSLKEMKKQSFIKKRKKKTIAFTEQTNFSKELNKIYLFLQNERGFGTNFQKKHWGFTKQAIF